MIEDSDGCWTDGSGVGLVVCFGGDRIVLRHVDRNSSSTAAGGLLETIAVAVHGQDMNMMGQPIEQRAGEPLRAQDRGPILERQVGGDDGRTAVCTENLNTNILVMQSAQNGA